MLKKSGQKRLECETESNHARKKKVGERGEGNRGK